MTPGNIADRHPAKLPFARTGTWTGVLHRDLGLCALQVERTMEPDLMFWSAIVVWGYTDFAHAATIISNRAARLAEAGRWRDLPDLQPVRHVRHQARVWLHDAVSDLESHHDLVYSQMVSAADRLLTRGLLIASAGVADIARNAKPRVPPFYVTEALKEAAKQHRIRYFVARKRSSGRG